MKKWLLVALLAILLYTAFRYREHANEMSPTPRCPTGSTLSGHTCSNGSLPTCPSSYSLDTSGTTAKCMSMSSQSLDDNTTTRCNTYWTDAITKWATGVAAVPAQPDTKCIGYAPSWIRSARLLGTLLNADGTPKTDTVTEAARVVSLRHVSSASDSDYAHMSSYAQSTGYVAELQGDALSQDADNGSLPTAVDERAGHNDDSVTNRPMNGPVFGDNGPFSGQAGNGQGSGMNAASTLTGSTYAHPPPTEGRLDPYDLWPGTKGSGNPPPPPSGSKVTVNGPSWGGLGTSTGSSSSSLSSSPAPALYGPAAGSSNSGLGWGYSQKNSTDTSMLPSYKNAGCDPMNSYSCTSRFPGNLESMPDTNTQATSYSLSNGSQKTNPVPFLTDFSAFQR